MFAPATSMSHVELHAVSVPQTEAVSGVRTVQHSAPAYVTAHSAPEEVESIAMLSQMLQNEAQRHQRERAGYGPPAPPKVATSGPDLMSDLMDGREPAGAQTFVLEQTSTAGGGGGGSGGSSGGGGGGGGGAGQPAVSTAPRISIDHLLGLPGFSAPIAPHFLAPRPGAVFVPPQPAHRGPAPPPPPPPPPPPATALVAATAAKTDEAEKENGWQRQEIKREPASGPEEAARGLLALHKHHCHRLGTDGQPVDGDELKRKAHMARHRRIHTNERPHVCNVCFKGFIRREHLQRHLKIHDPPLDEPAPRHPCDLCGSTFLRREHMRRHRKTHTGKKEHVCYLCGKAFFRREHVRKHVMSHTKSGSTVPSRERPAPAAQLQPAVVTLEGTDLSAEDAVRVPDVRGASALGGGGGAGLEPQPGPSHHQQQHQQHQQRRASDAPRNHVCGECGRRFSRKEHLQRHESTHSGTRPFACANCHRTFNRKEHLKKHQQAPNCAGRPEDAVKREPEETVTPQHPLPPPPTGLLSFQPAQHIMLPQHMLGAVSTSHALDMSTQAQAQAQPAHVAAGGCEPRPLQLLLK